MLLQVLFFPVGDLLDLVEFRMSASGLKLLNEGETNEAEGKMKSIS